MTRGMRAPIAIFLLAACSSPSTEDCLAEEQSLVDQVAGRILFYSSGCITDSDCALVAASVSCVTGCPAGVLASKVDTAAQDLMDYDSTICSGTQCSINIGCNPVHAVCKVGACVVADGSDGGADAGSPDGGQTPDAGSSGDAGG